MREAPRDGNSGLISLQRCPFQTIRAFLATPLHFLFFGLDFPNRQGLAVQAEGGRDGGAASGSQLCCREALGGRWGRAREAGGGPRGVDTDT